MFDRSRAVGRTKYSMAHTNLSLISLQSLGLFGLWGYGFWAADLTLLIQSEPSAVISVAFCFDVVVVDEISIQTRCYLVLLS